MRSPALKARTSSELLGVKRFSRIIHFHANGYMIAAIVAEITADAVDAGLVMPVRYAMRTYKDWQLFDEMPDGWKIDKTAGYPLHGYSFISDGRSIING